MGKMDGVADDSAEGFGRWSAASDLASTTRKEREA